MHERRDVTRTRITRSAKIIVPRRSPVIHCTVQNITSGGACLKLANTYGVPETFELTLRARPHGGAPAAWPPAQKRAKLGVALEKAEAAAS